MNPMAKAPRQSNYELLRLFAMFSIVFYHLLGIYWHDNDARQYVMFDALTVPFHFGVPVFVIISGYFRIRASWRGALKLLVPVFLYYVPIELAVVYKCGGCLSDYLHIFQFFSQTPYWFIQTYFWLFLLSPAINLYIQDSTLQKRLWTIGVLAFITMYVGAIGNDPSVMEGKNVLYFALLYIVGDTLHQYQSMWERISWKLILTAIILLGIGLVAVYFVVRTIPMRLFFPYNSIGMLFYSVLIFILFGHLRIRSSFINYLAASAFAIYLIHGEPTLFRFQIRLVGQLFHHIGYGFTFFMTLTGFSLLVMVVAIIIDKLLSPLYNRFSSYLFSKYV